MSILMVGTAVTRPASIGTLFRSDGSSDFTPVRGIPLDTGVQAITPHPQRPGVVFAATHGGVYQSVDAGASWNRLAIPGAPGEQFWSVAIHPQDADTMLVGCGPIGVYRTTDGGSSWLRMGRAEPMAEVLDMSQGKFFKHSRIMSLCYDPTNPSLVFGAVETSGFILSEDGGEHWESRSDALKALVSRNAAMRSQINVPDDYEGILDGHTVRVTPERPGVVFYACRMGLFSSADRGRSWRNHDIGRFAPISYSRDMRVAANDPKTIYLALSIASRSNSGALYRSDDVGATWKRADEPVTAVSTIMGMGAHVNDSNKVIYITRHGQVHWSEDGSRTWHAKQLPAEAGDGYCAAIM